MAVTKLNKKKEPDHYTLEITIQVKKFDKDNNWINKDEICTSCLGFRDGKELVFWSQKEYKDRKKMNDYTNFILYDLTDKLISRYNESLKRKGVE